MAVLTPILRLRAEENPTLQPATDSTLRWLIDPTGTRDFFANYWEKQPLVVKRRQPHYFDSLLSLDDVDRVITTMDRRYPDVALKNANRDVTARDYTVQGDHLDVAKVYQLFAEGSTITLAFLDNVLPALNLFCRQLESEFSYPFQTNVYLTPPGAQGAKAHYDTHDVFVLQVAGSKEWTIYGTPVELPLPGQEFDADAHPMGAPTLQFVLEPGDMAYIPRGVGHDAHSTDTVSLHITTGVLRYTWMNLLLEMVAHAGLNDSRLRHALPPGFARPGSVMAPWQERARTLLESACTRENFEAALNAFADRFVSTSTPPLMGQMAQMAALDGLTLDATVGARPGVNYRLHAAEDFLSIDCSGRTITFPAFAREELNFALNHERFVIGDLPGSLDDAGKLTLVRRLIREGLVMIHLPQAGGDVEHSER